jgi:hypothetical protein
MSVPVAVGILTFRILYGDAIDKINNHLIMGVYNAPCLLTCISSFFKILYMSVYPKIGLLLGRISIHFVIGYVIIYQ